MTGLEGIDWALTLWQPWAAYVVGGPKNIENRRWPPPKWIMGKRIAIHAGLKHDETADAWLESAFAKAFGDDSMTWTKHVPRLAQLEARGAILGTARVVGVHAPVLGPERRETSPWHMRDQYGWILADRVALPKPIACRGAQKLWRVPAALAGANERPTDQREENG